MADPFALAIKRFADKTARESEAEVRKRLLSLTSDIISNTPVDEGRARGSWQASVNSPNLSETNRTDKTGGSTIAAANSAIKDAPGRVFYLASPLPYMGVLEYGLYSQGGGATQRTTRDGFSVQAPAGWIRIAIAKAKSQQ